MIKYYQVKYHVKNHHSDNWSVFCTFDNEREAYDFLLTKIEEKLTKGIHKALDQFRIVIINEQEVYTTWQFPAESGH